MSGADNEVFNTLERAVSGDVNDLQSIAARFLSEMVRYWNATKIVGSQTDSPTNVVFGGLEVAPSGADVSVSPGALGQLSAVLPPAPGPLDSPFRLAWSDASSTVVMPAPGVETFYLVEGQMTEVVSSTQLRDIWTPPAGPFAPALVTKQTRRTIATQVVAGALGQAPAPSGGDWVPLAIVRRPAGGGPVVATDILDVRPLAEGGRPRPRLASEVDGSLSTVDGTSNVVVRYEMDGAGGARAFGGLAPIDPTTATYLSPTTVVAASSWFYLYLAPWSALGLSPRFTDLTVEREGVLVLSSVAPTATRRNSAALDLPAPFGVVQAQPLSAYLVGALHRNAGNTGWEPTWRVARDEFGAYIAAPTPAVGLPGAGSFAINFSGLYPTNAKSVEVQLNLEPNSAFTFGFATTAGSTFANALVQNTGSVRLRIPAAAFTAGAFDIFCGIAPGPGAVAEGYVVGWSY